MKLGHTQADRRAKAAQAGGAATAAKLRRERGPSRRPDVSYYRTEQGEGRLIEVRRVDTGLPPGILYRVEIRDAQEAEWRRQQAAKAAAGADAKRSRNRPPGRRGA